MSKARAGLFRGGKGRRGAAVRPSVAARCASRGRQGHGARKRRVCVYYSTPGLPPATLSFAVRTLACILMSAVLVSGCGSSKPESAAPGRQEAAAALAGAPAPLARLHRQANDLLGGGRPAFERRLDELKGYPVVVNKWASWCDPCRAEFPFFQRQAIERGKEVAFLGVDSTDEDADARAFLREFPVSYPSYRDPALKIAASFNGVGAFPSTAFYDSKGRLAYLRQGGYATEAKLAEDIERYAR